MPRDEMVKAVSIERLGKSPAVFDKQKLQWMNGQYIRKLDLDTLCSALETGERNARGIEAIASDVLQRSSIRKIDYVELRGAHDLSALEAAKGHVILAIAAFAGGTRLIDNMVFDVRDDAVDADVMLF